MNATFLRCIRIPVAAACLLLPPRPGHAVPPLASESVVVTLGEVLRDVAEANPTLAARRAMAAAAEAKRSPAGAWEAPMLELGVANVPGSGDFNAEEMTMKMVGLSQRVPLFAPNGLRRRAAAEEASAAGSATANAQLERYGAAIESYADAFYGIERAREASRHRAVTERFVDAAQARYRAGGGRLDDVLRAEGVRARARVDEAMFLAEAKRALARLAALRGREPDGVMPIMQSPPSLPIPADPATWIAAALEAHPRMLEANARRQGYELSARAAARSVWSGVDLKASYGQRGRDSHGMELDDLFSASVGFSLPLFSGSREGAMSAELRAMGRAAAAEGRQVELDLARDARSLHVDVSTATHMVALLADTAVTAQERAVEATWSAYASGSADLWRVFESNHELHAEYLLLLDARRSLARAQGALVALTGRADLAGLELPAIRRDER